MSLKALQLFLIVAQAASLRQAAQRLNMTPTALRRQIDSLEYYFGSELIDRNAGGISLIPTIVWPDSRGTHRFKNVIHRMQTIL